MSDIFFYTMIGAFVGGIALGTVWPVPLSAVVWLMGLALTVALIAERSASRTTWRSLLLVSVILLAGGTGMARWQVEPAVTQPSWDGKVDSQIDIEGKVVREPEQRANTTHVYVQASSTTVLAYTDRYAAVQYGDRVRVTGVLTRPESFTTDFGRTFNYPGYLAARGVGYTVPFADVAVVEPGVGNQFLVRLYRIKASFMEQLERSIPAPYAGLGEGLLLGVQQALGEELEEAFRRAGVIHIVVLSGYNVMLVVTFFMYVLAYVLPYRWRLVVGVGAIAVFAFLVGLSPTVVRASIMASLLLLLRFTNHTHHILRALCMAGSIMLLLNPYLLLYDIGFQLSFMATAGLILLVEPVSRLFTFVPTMFGAREFLTATIVTQFFVLPLLLYHIGEVSLVAIAANVLVLPMVPVAMLLTFLTGVLGWVWTIAATVCGYVAYVSLQYIISITTILADTPIATVAVPAFSPWILAVAYVLVGVATYVLMYRPQKSTETRLSTRVYVGNEWEIESEEALRERLTRRPPEV